MDELTKFVIERMDKHEERMGGKIDAVHADLKKDIGELQAFKNRVLGMAALAGGIGSLFVEIVAKHFI